MTIRKTSVLGRLVAELSWEGKNIKRYRLGGIGYENILVAEVLQALDFLPRVHFLGSVITKIEGIAIGEVKSKYAENIENIEFTLLPGNIYLRPSAGSHPEKIGVQPDGIMETSNLYGLIEAKGMGTSKFQAEQLAREFVILTREARDKIPLFLLILGKKPPVNINGLGKKTIKDGILANLETVLEKTEHHPYSINQLEKMVDTNVAWITWSSIESIIKDQMKIFNSGNPSTDACIERLVSSLTDSICRHSQ